MRPVIMSGIGKRGGIMTTAIVQIPVDMDVLHRAENAQRAQGRTLGDALHDYIEQLAIEGGDDITFVARTPQQVDAHMNAIIDDSADD